MSIRRFLSSSVRLFCPFNISVLALIEMRGLRNSWTMTLIKSSFILERCFSRVTSRIRKEAPITLGSCRKASRTGVMVILNDLVLYCTSFSSIFWFSVIVFCILSPKL